MDNQTYTQKKNSDREYNGTSIIQTPLATVCVQIIKITAEHTNNNTLSAFLY